MADEFRIELFAETDLVDEEVIQFWIREGAVNRAEAEVRVAETQFVALHDGAVAGVETAYLQWSPRLNLSLWHHRMFIGRDHRQGGLGMTLGLKAALHAQMMFTTGRDTRGAGSLIEVSNEGLKRNFDGAVWRWNRPDYVPDYTFIGENERGDHVRVHYFPGALAPQAPQRGG